MNIFVVSANINGEAMKAGDEIAVFDGAVCCGKTILKQAIVFTDKNSFAEITPSKKDDGLLNGYTIGNAIKFKIWDSRKNQELSGITAEFINPADGQTISAPIYTPGATAFVKLSVIVSGNKAPIPKAGDDQSVKEGEKVTLDGAGSSDPDGEAITYLWTSPAGIALSSATSAKPTFIAPEVQTDTDYSFFLIVNDGTVNSTADEVVIKVKQVNKLPVANAGPDQTVAEGNVVTLDATTSSDSDGNSLNYSWTAPSEIKLSSASVARPTFIAPEVVSDKNYTFSLIVNDGNANSTEDQVVITVKQVNKTPIANAGIDQTLDENSPCVLDGSGSKDPDGNTLTYLWTPPVGISLSSATNAKPTFIVPEVKKDTVLNFLLIVNDGTVYSESATVKVFVKNVIKTASEILSINKFIVYPNPSKGIYYIEGLDACQQNKIEIYSLEGKLISQKNSNSITEVVDITNQMAGIYLLLLNNKTIKIQKH
jgi:hypothetical protein